MHCDGNLRTITTPATSDAHPSRRAFRDFCTTVTRRGFELLRRCRIAAATCASAVIEIVCCPVVAESATPASSPLSRTASSAKTDGHGRKAVATPGRVQSVAKPSPRPNEAGTKRQILATKSLPPRWLQIIAMRDHRRAASPRAWAADRLHSQPSPERRSPPRCGRRRPRGAPRHFAARPDRRATRAPAARLRRRNAQPPARGPRASRPPTPASPFCSARRLSAASSAAMSGSQPSTPNATHLVADRAAA